MKGKTTSDRERFGPSMSRMGLPGTHGFFDVRKGTAAPSDMGETVTVEWTNPDLRQRIRDAANDRRSKRTTDNNIAMDALVLEALTKGWTTHDIARAALSSDTAIATRIAAHHLKDSVPPHG